MYRVVQKSHDMAIIWVGKAIKENVIEWSKYSKESYENKYSAIIIVLLVRNGSTTKMKILRYYHGLALVRNGLTTKMKIPCYYHSLALNRSGSTTKMQILCYYHSLALVRSGSTTKIVWPPKMN